MNLKRGLFRLWVLFTIASLVGLIAIYYSDLRTQIVHLSPSQQFKLPIVCDEARGTLGDDYTLMWEPTVLCWYSFSNFRSLYPEYKDLDDQSLLAQLYEKAGHPFTPVSPWISILRLIGRIVGLAIVLQAVVLGLGTALYWAFAGFVSRKPD